MKLSEILGWKEKKPVIKDQGANNQVKDKAYCRGHNTALTSCDREIDREALAMTMFYEMAGDNPHKLEWHSVSHQIREFHRKHADAIISTMPTWLKRSEGK